MPFEVTPVKQVDINFDTVEAGDRLLIMLDDKPGTRIFLTAANNPWRVNNPAAPEFIIGLEPELVPLPAYLAIFEQAQKVIRQRPYDMQKWYEKLENPTDLYSELVSAMLNGEPARASGIQIGEVPSFNFKQPFSFGNQHTKLSSWTAEAPIKRIAPANPWEATVEIGLIRSERQLHALRVR